MTTSPSGKPCVLLGLERRQPISSVLGEQLRVASDAGAMSSGESRGQGVRGVGEASAHYGAVLGQVHVGSWACPSWVFVLPVGR
ncbi:hypothetical protein [Streptomyces sp. NRRL B-1140]|uniref:hypothetical protein n=1 Tax=Streptomyces sp. NRRL B-1140 TaxID=1415549 RepID=UPI00131B3D82|nr:hypothetical protein [Streptomyces sp. NRRL B-1140]